MVVGKGSSYVTHTDPVGIAGYVAILLYIRCVLRFHYIISFEVVALLVIVFDKVNVLLLCA